jgi:hypothetical protein
MADIRKEEGPAINTAEGKELYENLFAGTGSREDISLADWKAGWAAIVGGINGIPTSRQFNTLQYISDLKSFLLYKAVTDLQKSGGTGIRIGPAEEIEKLERNMILFETIVDTNRIVKVHQKDAVGGIIEYELATLFKMAERRELIKSGETLSVIFGKVLRYLADIKENCFAGADDPFVLMTEATYKPPAKRTKGSLYGLITKIRGLIIIQFDRYVQGLEEPRVERTLYGVETKARGDVEASPYSYIGVIKCIVFVDDESTDVRMQEKLYAKIKETR